MAVLLDRPVEPGSTEGAGTDSEIPGIGRPASTDGESGIANRGLDASQPRLHRLPVLAPLLVPGRTRRDPSTGTPSPPGRQPPGQAPSEPRYGLPEDQDHQVAHRPSSRRRRAVARVDGVQRDRQGDEQGRTHHRQGQCDGDQERWPRPSERSDRAEAGGAHPPLGHERRGRERWDPLVDGLVWRTCPSCRRRCWPATGDAGRAPRPVELPRPGDVPKPIEPFWPLALEQRLGKAIAALLARGSRGRPTAVVPHHGAGREADVPPRSCNRQQTSTSSPAVRNRVS